MEKSFHKTALATGVAVALGVTSAPAFAQQEEGEVIEEIVTTGIRASLRRAADIKRQADGVVDAINAEDIGDFPDTNLAESLQRITGVSIDRDRGEGARVTVRGWGPQYNLVLLNGRQMPTSGGTQLDAQGTDRSFDFGDIASEAVSSVEIYKTGMATIPTGGIGSTINIKTTRPLEAPGLRMSLGAAGVYDTSSTKLSDDSWTGEISGIISNTFADDTIGVSLTAIRQEREHGSALATTSNWRTFPGTANSSWGVGDPNGYNGGSCEGALGNPGAPADVTPFIGQQTWGGIPIPCFDWEGAQTNRPAADSVYSVPQNIGYELADYERTRTNGQLTLQFRPQDNLTATLDYTFAQKEESRAFNNLSAWFNFGNSTSIWNEGDNVSPEQYTEFGLNGTDYSMGVGQDAYKNEKKSLGFNLLWDVTDRLSLEFDYHDSSSEGGPDSKYGQSALLSIAAFTRDFTTGYYAGGAMPVLELGLLNPLTPDDMRITGSTFQVAPSEMNIDQFRLNGNLEFDTGFIQSIDFGVQLTDVDNVSQFSNMQREAWFATTPIGAIADLMEPQSMVGAFSDLKGSSDDRRQVDYYSFSLPALLERADQLIAAGDMPITAPGDGNLGPCGTALCADFENFDTDRRTNEKSQSAYVQLNMATEWGNMPVDMRLGLRYEQTDVISRALVPTYDRIVWSGGNELAPVSTGSDFTKLKGDYDFVLPNFDLKVEFTDEWVGRFSYSETITRPNYTQIQGGITIGGQLRIDQGGGNRGNPALLPYESQNLDLSVEYYYGDGSYASVGYFHKDVDNFIGTADVEETAFNLPNPGGGPLAADARAAGNVTSGDIYSWILNNRTDAEGVNAIDSDGDGFYETGTITGVADRDPDYVFTIEIPVNVDKRTVDGWELNIQHNFGDTGFGFIANATFVDADVSYDINSLNQQFIISGLSDSANFIPYWENEDWSIRLAYNWRDAFTAGTGQPNDGNGPYQVDEYAQWDLSANYWATDNLQIYADIINLTDETVYTYGRKYEQTLLAGQYGARYTLGVRYKF
jgi:TonB-dependent receptor